MKPVELVPQDITRVFLNLFGNGFYAANKRAHANGVAGYRPVLHVATHDLGDTVEIRVRDNGIGIPPDDPRQTVPAVLHHQADRRGHRLGAVDQL